MRRRWQDILFALIAAAAFAVAILVALVWTGHFVSDGSEADPAKPAVAAARKRPAQPAPLPAVTRPAQSPEHAVAHTVASAPRVRIVASRGDCWVAARKGAADGPALVARVLREGETVTLRGRHIFLELGAAGNVDVSVNGKARPIPSGTTNLVVG